MEPKLQNSALRISKNPYVSIPGGSITSKIPFASPRQQKHKIPEIRLPQLHKIVEEQRCQFENLGSASLLFYLPVILTLFYFWF